MFRSVAYRITKLRARVRTHPCRVGWHVFVLAFTGRAYVRLCEHCGKVA